jgi:hypothetical protein
MTNHVLRLKRRSIPVWLYTRLWEFPVEEADFCKLFWATVLAPFGAYFWIMGKLLPKSLAKGYQAAARTKTLGGVARAGDRTAAFFQGHEWVQPARWQLVSISDDWCIFCGYVAGLLDGEGTVRFRNGRYLSITIYSTNLELLAFLEERIGGRVASSSKACESGCERQHVHNNGPGYCWSASGERAAIVLRAILPTLIIKRDIAAQSLRAHDGCRNRKLRWTETVATDMAARGWPIVAPPLHGEERHYNAGCRCTDCRAAHAAHARSRSQRAA